MTQEDLARDGLSGDQGVGGATLVLSAPPPRLPLALVLPWFPLTKS